MNEIVRFTNPEVTKQRKQKIITKQRWDLTQKRIIEQKPEERVFNRLNNGLLSNPNQLAKELGLTKPAVNLAIKQLNEKGAIKVFEKNGTVLVEEIHPDKLNGLPHKKTQDEVLLFDNPKRKENGDKKRKAKNKDLVPKEKTFRSIKEHPDLESIRFWGRGKVAKNIVDLIKTRAIEIAIKKHPEKLEQFFEKTNTAKLYYLLKENAELKTKEIRNTLKWRVTKTNKQLAKLFNMGLAGRREAHGKIFLVEAEKGNTQLGGKETKEREMKLKIESVLKTPVGRTFGLLDEKPDLNLILSLRGKVAKNMEKLIEAGAIEIEVRKHPEKLNSSSRRGNSEITILEKARPLKKKRVIGDPEINKIMRQRNTNWFGRYRKTNKIPPENIKQL